MAPRPPNARGGPAKPCRPSILRQMGTPLHGPQNHQDRNRGITRDVDLAGDIAKARAVRKLMGDDFPLAFDSNNGYSVQGAIRVGRALEELGYVWFEEPVQHYHVESVAKVAAALDIAVSAGEQEYTLQGIKRLIEAGVDIVPPDIVKGVASPASATWRCWPGRTVSTWSRTRRSPRSATPPTCTSWPR